MLRFERQVLAQWIGKAWFLVIVAHVTLALVGTRVSAGEGSGAAAKPTSLGDSKSCATAGCHVSVKGEKFLHAPVRLNRCLNCHEVTDEAKHAFRLAAEPPELCNTCHDPKDKGKFAHTPVQDGRKCFNCHNAHGSNTKSLLNTSDTRTLCLSCHKEMASTESKRVAHAELGDEQACVACHEPHSSDYAGLVRERSRDLCMKCHSKTVKLPDESELPAAADLVGEPKYVHGPVMRGKCSSCHLVHGGDTFRLLKADYPTEFYAPYSAESYALCFGCHEEKLALEPKTTTLTEFRNGDENLHFMHVNKPDKGRTCRACHSPHASTQAKLIRASVAFGEWAIPVSFTKTETGGTCAAGCHAPKTYDRSSPVDYAAPVAEKPAAETTGDAAMKEDPSQQAGAANGDDSAEKKAADPMEIR